MFNNKINLFKKHRHKFIKADWNKEYGPDFIPLFDGSLYAIYKYLYKCSCGEEKIRTSIGLI